MKALSIRQPWAWLVCRGFKDVENRNWATKFRGRIYVHASKALDDVTTEGAILRLLTPSQREEYFSSPRHRGAIIGEVDIIDCVTVSDSRWFTGRFGFVLTNPELYEKSVKCRGKLSFFNPEIE